MIIARTILRSFIVIGIITVLVVGIASSSAVADEKTKGLQGSWRVTITGGAGTPDLPSWYQALVTFGADGGLVATITDPFLNTGHGAWGKNEKNTFPPMDKPEISPTFSRPTMAGIEHRHAAVGFFPLLTDYPA